MLPLAGLSFCGDGNDQFLYTRGFVCRFVKTGECFGFIQDFDRLNGEIQTPADTIKTKTIKIIHKQGSPDSTITETYDVKVIGDTARGTKIIYYNDKKMNGDTVKIEYAIKDNPEIILSADSIENVIVNTNVMQKEKVVITKNSTTGIIQTAMNFPIRW